jgi:integrase
VKRHFDAEVIVLSVRWYFTYKLSYRDLATMMAERGVVVSHTTIMRWVIRYAPEFEKRWSRFARSVGCSWRVDETYIAIKGSWHYLYRAVDKHDRTVDFLAAYGTHSLRRTKPTLIYRRTRNLRAVQLLLGHTKLESTVRYLGIEVDDALEIAEQTEL